MGYTGKHTIPCDFLQYHRPRLPSLPEWRSETKPGIQAQVDWAECRYTHPDGMSHKVHGFHHDPWLLTDARR